MVIEEAEGNQRFRIEMENLGLEEHLALVRGEWRRRIFVVHGGDLID